MTRREFAVVPVLLAQGLPVRAAEKTYREAEIAPKVKQIVVKLLEAKPAAVVESARIVKDLGADSLNFVELIMEMEDQFAIQNPDVEAKKVVTVGDLIQCVKKHLAAAKRLT